MTRKYEKHKEGEIVRRCRHCGITDRDIPFLVSKDTRSGRWYKSCLCRECYKEICKETRRRWYNRNKDREIRKSYEWNCLNRDRYNKLRRERTARRAMEVVCSYEISYGGL